MAQSLRLGKKDSSRLTVIRTVGLGLFLTSTTAVSAPAQREPDQPQVTTLAGSGALGIMDGGGALATFVAPVGLHFGVDGTLYVADRGAQRIRSVTRAGFVSTVAGSGALVATGLGVPGGYADGPALTARFDDPEDVVELLDRSLVVADMANHCLRKIAHGIVDTFAGRCGTAGKSDGPAGDARFGRPRSLAVSAGGDVFVVDPPNGIRRISGGRVTTFATAHGSDAVSIAAVPNSSDLVVSSLNQFDVMQSDGKVTSEFPIAESLIDFQGRGDKTPVGPAVGLAAFSSTDVVYADPLYSQIVFAQILGPTTYIRTLGLPSALSQPVEDAQFRDGRGVARFDEPTGVAVAPDGRVAVADLGNRRIRLLTNFNRYSVLTNTLHELPETPDSSVVRVALVGNSALNYMQGWDDSISGMVQRAVNQSRGPGRKRVEIYPIVAVNSSVSALLSLIDQTLSSGGVDAVVLDVPEAGLYISYDDRAGSPDAPRAAFPVGWTASAASGIARVGKDLRSNGIAFAALIHPGVLDFGDEAAYLRVEKGALNPQQTTSIEDPSAVEQNRADALAAVRGTGVPVVDCWPTMLADHASADRRSLFFAWDHHFSPHGRAVVASQLAAYLSKPGVLP